MYPAWTIFLSLFCVTDFVRAYDPATCIQCRKSHVCVPPECFCCRDTMPLETHKVPQMVFFTFDDAVNPAVAKHYQDLFDSSRLNPNGCPIRMTLFISHRNTVYSYVREFYEKGMEIASHSVTHSHPNAHTFLREAKKQKENLAKKANIPESEIVGWRSPFLEPLGDTQPTVLKHLGYEYDATLTITKKGSQDKAITPFTLDHGWPYDCKIKPCPSQSHNGFWEVPVVSVKDYKNRYNCVYIDACHSPPPSESTAYKFLWDNFQRYYSTNRAPMGINMHASWFYYPDRKAAMDKFIKQLVKMDDVYILTVKQVIEWLKTPTPLNQIKTFKPWMCGGNETIGTTKTTNPPPTTRRHTNIDPRLITPQPTPTNKPLQTNRNVLVQSNQNPQVQVNNKAQMQHNTNARMQPVRDTQVQNNAQIQTNNWQLQQQNQMRNNAFSRQPIGPTAVPFQISHGMQTPIWPQVNLNGLPPVAIPPLSPNFPAIRFWWRPPPIVDPQMQMEMHRREAIQRQRMMQEQQQSALQQVQFQRDQRQEVLRQEMMEKQRQQMLLQQKAEEERLRKEQLQKQQNEFKRQQLIKQQHLEKKLMEEKKQERLRQEQIEKQKQEEIMQQELIKQQQLEQQQKEERLRKERIKQNQLRIQKHEDLRQKEIQRQKEKQRIEEKLYQERIRQDALQREEQLKQQQKEKQTIEETKLQAKIGKQTQNELMQSTTFQALQQRKQNSSDLVVNENSHIQIQEMNSKIESSYSKPMSANNFSKKLDEILTHNKKDRIGILQQLSLRELQLLQAEVNRRMKKGPANRRFNSSLLALKKRVNQDVNGVVKQRALEHHKANDIPQQNSVTSNAGIVNSSPTQFVEETMSVTYTKTKRNLQTKPSIADVVEFTTSPPSYEAFQSDTKAVTPQKTKSATLPTSNTKQQILVTEKPKLIIPQETIPVQFGPTTTISPIDKLGNDIGSAPDIPFFYFSQLKSTSLDQQPAVVIPKTNFEKQERKSVWHTDAFDINSLSGPWERKPTLPPSKPESATKTPERRTSLKLLPVAISLFNTDNIRPKPQLSYRAYVRPNLVSSIKFTNADTFSEEAVSVSERRKPITRASEPKTSFEFSKPVDILPLGLRRSESIESAVIVPTKPTATSTPKPLTTTTTTITTPTTTTTTTTTPTTTTTIPPTTTPTTTTTTTAQTTSTTTTVPSTTTASTTTTTEVPATVTVTKATAQPPTAKVAKHTSIQQSFSTQQRKYQTLIPIPSRWQLSQPLGISPYRPFIVPRTQAVNNTTQRCNQGENCFLPNCFCKTESVPLGMNLNDVPQIVYITIDGSLNFHSLAKIRKLFSRRTNPNGCKIKGTMFITDAGSSYRISDLLLRDGIELAMMGMNSRPYTNKEELKSDILLQRQRIAESSNINEGKVHGWRSPGFKSLGDDHFAFLNNESFYDSSVILDRGHVDKQKLWPFTLDFGLNEDCELPPCPRKRHPGLWEIPVIPFLGEDNSSSCEYIDACTKQPKDAVTTFNYLMKNFNLYYKTNRAPFAIRLKQIWFHWYYRENLKGLFKFLDTVLGYGDVYVSSISDMLQWMRKPVKLQNINTFSAWKC